MRMPFRIHLFSLLFTLFTVFVLTGTAFANTKALYPIGEIAAIQGQAWYGDGADKSRINEGDPVFFNSHITTGADARLHILFIDDTEITLGEEASLQIDEYIFDPYDSKENKGAFSIKGAFLWVSGLISKRDEPRVEINTPRGSIGIRGTTFWGGELEEGYGVVVTDGLVEFAGDWGSIEIPRDRGFILSKKVRQAIEENRFKDLDNTVTEWGEHTMERALSTIAFDLKGTAAFKKKMYEMREDNIRKRHDYRGRMFPYKKNPFHDRLKLDPDEFFTDEFMDMKNKR